MNAFQLLTELVDAWEVMAGLEENSNPVRRQTLRECADTLRHMISSGLNSAGKSPRELELEELLRSACAIADRRGADTAWERFAASVHAVGLTGVTARTYRVLPSDTEA